MENLTFVGLSDDGSGLILTSVDGTRYLLAIDERLRSATRGGRAHVDLSDGPVTARELQARLRAGATPAELVDVSGWTVDRVEAFAAPILQERGYIAQKAQACPVGRGEDDPTLGELVVHRLAERGVDEESVRWDAWRRDDGRWTVLLAYPAGKGDRVATWSFDLAASALTPDDEEARWFSEIPAAPERPRLIRVADDDSPVPARPPQAGKHPAGRGAAQPEATAMPGPSRSTPAPPAPAPEPVPDSPRWDEVLFGMPKDPH